MEETTIKQYICKRLETYDMTIKETEINQLV